MYQNLGLIKCNNSSLAMDGNLMLPFLESLPNSFANHFQPNTSTSFILRHARWWSHQRKGSSTVDPSLRPDRLNCIKRKGEYGEGPRQRIHQNIFSHSFINPSPLVRVIDADQYEHPSNSLLIQSIREIVAVACQRHWIERIENHNKISFNRFHVKESKTCLHRTQRVDKVLRNSANLGNFKH